MAWDKTEPKDTTKLRNLGAVIRPNWVALENAESTFKPQALNLINRNSVGGLAENPTAIADTVILYSKKNTAGKPQLFTIDPDSVITQLTGVCIRAWGNFNGSTGAINASYNLKPIHKDDTGKYTLEFIIALSSANYAVVSTGQMISNFGTGGIVGVDSLATTGFKIHVRSLTSTTGGADLNPVCFIVIGA